MVWHARGMVASPEVPLMAKIPSGSRAAITGAGSGFGRAVALELASRRARLLLSDVDEASVAETVALARASGGIAESMIVDVRDPDRVAAMAERANDLW